jgi:hypothetical protein
MTWHPLTIAVWFLLGMSWAVYLPAALRLIQVVPGWEPLDSGSDQLRRERLLELAAAQGRWTLGLQAGAAVLLVIGISNVWPPCIPGAMCGTGVLQAMGNAGRQTLFYFSAAAGVLYCWQVLFRLDATQPQGPLAVWHGRVLLLAAPLMALGTHAWLRAVTSVQSSQPVNCCAVVYQQAGNAAAGSVFSAWSGNRWIWLCSLGTLMVILWGGILWRRPLSSVKRMMALMATVTLIWVPVAVAALKFGFAPYIYQVLSHPCPWCLFLPVHGAVGFAVFGLLALITVESVVAMIVAVIGRHFPGMRTDVGQRMRRCGRRIMLGGVGFLVLALWPVLSWRVRFGVWIT